MTVVDSIVQSAKQNNVDPLLAIADAIKESNLNPNAVGDNGSSYGLFQLHRGGELGSLSPDQAFNPTTNANTALSVFQATEKSNPSLTQGALAAASERPANQTAYANSVQDIYNSLKQIQSQNVNYNYNDIVTHYNNNLSQYANSSAGTTGSVQNTNATSDTVLGGLLDAMGLSWLVNSDSSFSQGTGTFLTNVFLPATWVRVLAFFIGIGLLILGFGLIIADYKKTGGDSSNDN